MRYRGKGFGYDILSTVDEFIKHFENVREIGKTLVVNDKMPSIAVMDFKAD